MGWVEAHGAEPCGHANNLDVIQDAVRYHRRVVGGGVVSSFEFIKNDHFGCCVSSGWQWGVGVMTRTDTGRLLRN